MTKEPYFIKTRKGVRITTIAICCLILVITFFYRLENGKTNFQESPKFVIFITIITTIAIVFNTYKIIKNTSSLVLTSEGIKFSGLELLRWEDISSFQILNNISSDNLDIELIINLINGKKKTNRIDELDISYDVLASLILEYQGNHGILYLGYKEI